MLNILKFLKYKINLIIFIIIIIFCFNIKAFSIFEPNQLPFIDYLPTKSAYLDEENRKILQKLENNRFYILHSYKMMNIRNKVQCDSIIGESFKDNINQLVFEINKYNDLFFNKINFNYLVLCQNLKLNGNLTAGIPSNNVSTLIFDINLNKEIISRALHHEIFHMIKQHKNYQIFDAKFNQINDKNFKYNGCPLCSDSIDIDFKNNIDGFVTEYSKNTIEEDQAEVFAAIMSMKDFDAFYSNNKKVLLKKKLIYDLYLSINKE